jgi:hypothetical protein
MAATKTQRRGFLGALFAAPVVAAVPAIAAQAPLVAPVVEAPELLAIGQRLPDFAARAHAAKTRLEEAVAAYAKLKPVLPSEVIAPEYGSMNVAELERGLDNEPIRIESGRLRYLYSSRKVKIRILESELPRNTKEGKRLRRIARLAAKYEKDREAAISASGYREASWARSRLQMEMQDDFAKAALAVKPLTMRGVAIYAAIIAVGNGPARRENGPCYGSEALGIAMAEAFVRLTTDGPAQVQGGL